MDSNSSVLKINNLTKYYGKTLAVNDLSLDVKVGTIHGFLGPNGAGKTTTIRCALGLLKPNTGRVHIFGQKIGINNVQILKRIGYLPGDVYLYQYYTVKQLLDYFQALHRLKEVPLRKELIERLDLDESIPVKALSKGNRQKVGIVQALQHDPDFLILDEPTSGLDPLLQNEFLQILDEFRGKKTIFFSSHVLSEVQRVCDKVSIIREGVLVSTEDVSTLSENLGRQLILKLDSVQEPLEIEGLTYIKAKDENHNKNLQRFLVTGDIKLILQQISNIVNVNDIILPEASVEDYFMRFYTGEFMEE
ncbi:MAG: ABC transporter ATP-binding protein [Candidatus Hodarchaeales archaeon]